ncbi:hypothetical protein Fcan01_08531 [Folsomia candida]|uniref:Uncharacterized protein n=1 Tax=Folsomia candida TaxID=158441 RepID=A0A226EMJ9_FOLCA|nr:hypothetical protein Fcan01_08531 [Folsomia candida]
MNKKSKHHDDGECIAADFVNPHSSSIAHPSHEISRPERKKRPRRKRDLCALHWLVTDLEEREDNKIRKYIHPLSHDDDPFKPRPNKGPVHPALPGFVLVAYQSPLIGRGDHDASSSYSRLSTQLLSHPSLYAVSHPISCHSPRLFGTPFTPLDGLFIKGGPHSPMKIRPIKNLR